MLFYNLFGIWLISSINIFEGKLDKVVKFLKNSTLEINYSMSS